MRYNSNVVGTQFMSLASTEKHVIAVAEQILFATRVCQCVLQSVYSTFPCVFILILFLFYFPKKMSRRKSIFLSSQETQPNPKQLDEFSNEIDQNLRTLAFIHPFSQTEKSLLVKVHCF